MLKYNNNIISDNNNLVTFRKRNVTRLLLSES